MVDTSRDEDEFFAFQALMSDGLGRWIVGLDLDPAVEHEVDLVELRMVVADGGLDVWADGDVKFVIVAGAEDHIDFAAGHRLLANHVFQELDDHGS